MSEASGHIQRLAVAKSSYTPSNVSRRLRELAEEGEVEVKYEKNHAYYGYKPEMSDIEWFDSLPDHKPEHVH